MNGEQKNLFICHSSFDDELVKEFRIHLDPLFHASALRVWDDSMLFIGQPWREAIEEQMTNTVGAIVLVSPRLLQSVFVRDTELPEFLGFAESLRMPLYCFFVEHSVVNQLDFRFSVNGRPHAKKLTEYHGLNSPSEPLILVPRNRRSKVLADAALRIYRDICERYANSAKSISKRGGEVKGYLPPLTKPPSQIRNVDKAYSSSSTAKRNGVAPSQRPGPQSIFGIVDRPHVIGRLTLYVRIDRTELHPRYKKPMKKTKVVAVHWYEDISLDVGDLVEIQECRPISRTKHHVLINRVDRPQ